MGKLMLKLPVCWVLGSRMKVLLQMSGLSRVAVTEISWLIMLTGREAWNS